ncbi:hypothetical protein HID58_087840 [Brassica napus]|uniref:Uncharacterized protein n=1 Tax=Brassica napus TaxID=3708 RepID=A0ABQ7XUF7_BRANA|nr:hypothetical protein HID58_087840 [Brassica napus]
MLRLDGEASEVDEPGESLGKWVKRTFVEGEEDEFEIGEPCEEKRCGSREVNRGEKQRKEKEQNTNRKNRE